MYVGFSADTQCKLNIFLSICIYCVFYYYGLLSAINLDDDDEWFDVEILRRSLVLQLTRNRGYVMCVAQLLNTSAVCITPISDSLCACL